MNVAQATFLVVTAGLSALGTFKMYPEVAKHAASSRQSFLAALMAATLFGTFAGMVSSMLVNAATVLILP